MVSIVVPTYNRKSLLPRAVESVREQTLCEWELILVDDGSTDGTGELVQSWNDPRIRYVRQDHRGVSSARNCGIRLARHPWIAFLDSDDCWKPQKLEQQVRSLQLQPDCRLAHMEEIWIRKGRQMNPKKIHRKYGGWIYRHCLPRCVISPSSVLMHESIFREVGPFDEGLPVCEDYDLWLRVCCRFPVLFIDQPLVTKFGGHADQLSGSRWGLDRYRLEALIRIAESGVLTPEQLEWTAGEIVRKAGILASGCRNHGKAEEAARYADIAGQWREPSRQ